MNIGERVKNVRKLKPTEYSQSNEVADHRQRADLRGKAGTIEKCLKVDPKMRS